jgi:uncharacterized protein (TIGR02300 family)
VAREPPLSHGIQEGHALANPELGAKQICPNCQSKFYDLGKRPAVCPKCGTSFDPEEALKTRRVRARSSAPDYEDEVEKPAKVVSEADADGFEDEVDETPEIDAAVDEVVEADDDADVVEGGPAAPADDLGVDFAEDEDLEDEGDDVPFLEDEDDDDNFEDEIEGLPDDRDD